MKQILAILTLLVLFSCNKHRETYLINGQVEGIPDSSIIDLYIKFEDIGEIIKSDTIINGFFEFSDTLSSRPTRMNLRIRDWQNYFGYCDIWADYGLIKVTGKGKYLSSWVVESNVEEQLTINSLQSKTKNLAIQIDSLYMIMFANRQNPELYTKIRKSIDSISSIKTKMEFDLISKNPNSQTAIELLYLTAKHDTSISIEKIKEVFDKVEPKYHNTLYGEGIIAVLKNNHTPEVGDTMVDFQALDTSGVKHSLLDYKGRFILLDFWSLGCGPCIMAIPETRKLSLNNSEVLTVVGVNMVVNDESWRKASKKDSITWINLSDGKGTFAGASSAYGIKGFPTYILINPDGVIIEKWMGYWPDVFKEKLSKHIEGLKI